MGGVYGYVGRSPADGGERAEDAVMQSSTAASVASGPELEAVVKAVPSAVIVGENVGRRRFEWLSEAWLLERLSEGSSEDPFEEAWSESEDEGGIGEVLRVRSMAGTTTRFFVGGELEGGAEMLFSRKTDERVRFFMLLFCVLPPTLWQAWEPDV